MTSNLRFVYLALCGKKVHSLLIGQVTVLHQRELSYMAFVKNIFKKNHKEVNANGTSTDPSMSAADDSALAAKTAALAISDGETEVATFALS